MGPRAHVELAALRAHGAPACSLLDVFRVNARHLGKSRYVLLLYAYWPSTRLRLHCDRSRPTLFAHGEHAGAIMRLLKRLLGGDLELISFKDDDLPPYAILSH